VREEFLARDIGYDAALASLDPAKLYLQQGRTAEVFRACAPLGPPASRRLHQDKGPKARP
jgi:hypothetical protein